MARKHIIAASYAVFLTILLGLGSVGEARQTPVLRIDRVDASKPPKLRLYVTDLNAALTPISDRKRKSYRLLVDGVPHTSALSVQARAKLSEPLAMTLVVQVSPSMREALTETVDNTKRLVRALPSGSKVGLITYTDVVVARVKPTKSEDVLRAVDDIRIRDEAVEVQLIDALKDALETLDNKSLPRQRLIVLISDGLNSDFKTQVFADIGRRALDKNVAIHSIGFAPLEPERLRRSLYELSRRSRGTLRTTKNPRQITKAFQSLQDEINEQQVLSFDLSKFFDGKLHELQIELPEGQASNPAAVELKKLAFEEKEEKGLPIWAIILLVGGVLTLLTVMTLVAMRIFGAPPPATMPTRAYDHDGDKEEPDEGSKGEDEEEDEEGDEEEDEDWGSTSRSSQRRQMMMPQNPQGTIDQLFSDPAPAGASGPGMPPAPGFAPPAQPQGPAPGFAPPPQAPAPGFAPPPQAPAPGFAPPPAAGFAPPAPGFAPPPAAGFAPPPAAGFAPPPQAPAPGFAPPPQAPAPEFAPPPAPSFAAPPQPPAAGFAPPQPPAAGFAPPPQPGGPGYPGSGYPGDPGYPSASDQSPLAPNPLAPAGAPGSAPPVDDPFRLPIPDPEQFMQQQAGEPASAPTPESHQQPMPGIQPEEMQPGHLPYPPQAQMPLPAAPGDDLLHPDPGDGRTVEVHTGGDIQVADFSHPSLAMTPVGSPSVSSRSAIPLESPGMVPIAPVGDGAVQQGRMLDRKTMVIAIEELSGPDFAAWIVPLDQLPNCTTYVVRDNFIIGSDESCDLPFDGLSPRHGVVKLDSRGFLIETTEGGQIFSQPLNDGDTFRVGHLSFLFKVASRFPAKQVGAARVEVLDGMDQGRSIALQEGVAYAVGSAPDCDLVIRGAGVAMRHAVVLRKERVCYISDLGGEAGILFGDREVGRHALNPGDEVSLGGIRLIYTHEDWNDDQAPTPDWAVSTDVEGLK
ncbi:MAG: VWA domain-containing protein [Deltaproteobacteria bacterium]|nr:VWA domain-containing protein [Deltaproteobacteria bacterium]